jgi:Mrp family chromosome partitioning ATPase
MLQALKQIEARSQYPQPSTAAVLDNLPAEEPVADVGTSYDPEAMWRQVESTLAMDLDAAAVATPAEQPADPQYCGTGVSPALENAGETLVSQSEEQATCFSPRPATVDAYGDLADKLLAQWSAASSTVVMLSSPGDGEGTTTTIARLAAALAQRAAGAVLAIDGNCRRPALAARLGVPTADGLPLALAGAVPWSDLVQQTAVPGLSLLPGGSFGEDAVLESILLEPLLAEIRQQYRLVLIDTPSLRHADAVSIAACCDASYLVVRLGTTTCRALGEAAALLGPSQGKLQGCIVVE